MCNSKVSLLFKKGDPLDPVNYRAFRRFLQLCSPIAFRTGERESQDDNIFTLQARIAIKLSKPKGKLFAAFVDFRRAFDSVVHAALWKSLYEAGVSVKIIKDLQSMYQRASMKINLNSSDKTDTTDVTQGLLQDDSLSPLIFAILLHNIIDFFKEHVNYT